MLWKIQCATWQHHTLKRPLDGIFNFSSRKLSWIIKWPPCVDLLSQDQKMKAIDCNIYAIISSIFAEWLYGCQIWSMYCPASLLGKPILFVTHKKQIISTFELLEMDWREFGAFWTVYCPISWEASCHCQRWCWEIMRRQIISDIGLYQQVSLDDILRSNRIPDCFISWVALI